MSEKAIKDLGRKARARLEEENSKRREIVQINEAPQEGKSPEKRKSSIQISARKVPKKRKRATTTTSNKRTKKDVYPVNPNIDTRIPRVYRLIDSLPDDKKKLTDVVRLHGVPVGTQRNDVARFFSGLDIGQVFVLPSNPCRIEEWDAEPEDKGKVILPRHPESFRVYARFKRPPIATLAAQRSGETLFVSQKTNDNGERMGATIAVTQVLKKAAKYLVQHMAIPIQGNLDLEDALAECEESIPDEVPKLLWSAAARTLDFSLSDTSTAAEMEYPLFRDLDKASQLDHSTKQSQSFLVQLLSNLRLEHHKLTNYHQDPYATIALECGCPELLAQPSFRLIYNSTQLLKDRIMNVEQYLHMIRTVQSRQLRKPRSVLDTILSRHRSFVEANSSSVSKDESREMNQDKTDKENKTKPESKPLEENFASGNNGTGSEDESPKRYGTTFDEEVEEPSKEQANSNKEKVDEFEMLFESDSDSDKESGEKETSDRNGQEHDQETKNHDESSMNALAKATPQLDQQNDDNDDVEEDLFEGSFLPTAEETLAQPTVLAPAEDSSPPEKEQEQDAVNGKEKENKEEALFTFESDSDAS